MRIREASALDDRALDELSELLVAVVDDGASVGFLPPLDPADAREYWLGVCKPGTALLVAEVDGRIVGTGQLHLESRPNGRHRAEVAKVLVHPRWQRRGIGRALMERLEEIARREARTLLVLDTRQGDPSNRLYTSMGWIEAGRIPHYARSGEGSLDTTVLYYKELA